MARARTYYRRTKNRKTGTHILVCESDQGDIDDGLPWATICDEHGSLVCHETLELARGWASCPEWCEDCQELMREGRKYSAAPAHARNVPVHAAPDERDEAYAALYSFIRGRRGR